MSDANGSHRIQVVESNVREMKVELSHTRAQIEQMMGMMQQLLQAKSADGDQKEEESGGTGRRDTNDDSGGAGRAPREEGSAGARVSATRATATGGRVSNRSRRAWDGSRPADHMGQRPEVPAGVGPIIDMQCGEARHSFTSGIAAYDGDDVLSPGFQRQPCVVSSVQI